MIFGKLTLFAWEWSKSHGVCEGTDDELHNQNLKMDSLLALLQYI